MSVQLFIAELERRNLLSDRVVARLREAAAAPERPLSANALATFLVQKKHLSEQQAADVLSGLVGSGVNLDAALPAEEIAAASSATLQSAPKQMTLADAESTDDDAEGSSIFAPYLTGRPTKKDAASPTAPGDSAGSFVLTPVSDSDAQNPNASRQLRSDDALLLQPAEPSEPMPSKASRRKIAEVIAEESAIAAPRPTDDDELLIKPAPVDATKAPTVRHTTRFGRAAKIKKDTKDTKETKKKDKPAKAKKQWDSPLILLGGGGLVLLLICGAGVWWLLNWESGDQQLMSARAAVDSGAYTQAIEHYQEFLLGNSRHPERSLARVQLAMVRIRQATEARNYAAAFDLAVKELADIEDEEDFDEAQGELAALLPQIALGLAQQAEAAPVGSEEAAKLIELTNKALELCNNVAYLPKRLRDEARLSAVRETLEHVERRQRTQHALDEGLKQMEEAIAGNDTGAAYKVHQQFIKERPELATNDALVAVLHKTTVAEMAAVRLVDDEQPAETSERPTPWVASLALANRRIKPAASRGAPAAGPTTAIIRLDGAVYGLDAASGRLLWRRHLGHARRAWSQLIGNDVILADAAQNELLRLDAATGRLVWRQVIGEPVAPPLVVGERGLLPADSGRLYVIDLKSGARTGYLQFAQPLRVTPAVDRNSQRLYLTGDHSSLYTISLADLSCLGVYYFGHAPGSIGVSPASVMDKVAVLENNGVETSRLRLMSLDDKGAIAGQVAEQRLTGLASSPPFVANRRVVVFTDRGQIDVYEIGAGEGEVAITLIATRPATGSQPLVRHSALTGRNIWVGDTQLSKFVILPTGNRLPAEAIEDNFVGATFDHPLVLYGDTLIHARRPKDRAGVVVTASDTAQGSTLWETDLAIPPVGEPVTYDSAKTVAVASAEGYLFNFDEAAIRSRVQDEPLAAELMPAELPALTAAVSFGQGRVAFCAAGSDRLLLYNPALGAQSARWIQLESPLACAVTALGDGFIAPTQIGQVFYLSAVDGASLATPFQPVLQPQTQWNYKPAGAVAEDARQFVIADGRQKIYLVARVDQPQPHWEAVAEVDAGPYPIESPIIVLGDRAMAVAGSTRLVQFQLPSLQPVGESSFPAPVVWGPFRIGDAMLVATADGQLMSVSATGETTWKAATEHGDLIGAPLTVSDSVLIAYKNGILERRSLSDGKQLGASNLENPLATGPVPFLQRLVVAATDGTLLVVEQP